MPLFTVVGHPPSGIVALLWFLVPWLAFEVTALVGTIGGGVMVGPLDGLIAAK